MIRFLAGYVLGATVAVGFVIFLDLYSHRGEAAGRPWPLPDPDDDYGLIQPSETVREIAARVIEADRGFSPAEWLPESWG